MYYVVRMIFFAAIAAGVILLYRKRELRLRRAVSIIAFVGCAVLCAISALLPVENLFIRFSDPEQVFKYMAFGDIEEIIEGKDSAFILYSDGDELSHMIVRGNERWKIGTALDYGVYKKAVIDDKYYVFVYKYKRAEDYYVIVWDPFSEGTVNVSDPDNMYYHIEKNGNDNYYYRYLDLFTDDYKITVDGKEYEIN